LHCLSDFVYNPERDAFRCPAGEYASRCSGSGHRRSCDVDVWHRSVLEIIGNINVLIASRV
jgi:hypothetical protein